MRFFLLSSLALCIYAPSALAALHFTNTAFNIKVGQPFLVTWAGASETAPTNLTLHDSDNALLFVIDSGITDNFYSWTPSADVLTLSSSFYFEIEVTFELITSDKFTIQSASAASSTSSTVPNSSTSPSSTSSIPSTKTSSSDSSSTSLAQSTTGGTSSTPSPTNSTESNIVAKSKLKPGAIGGIFVGVLAVILGIITLIWFLLRRRKQQRAKENEAIDLQTPELEGGAATNPSKQDGLIKVPSRSGEIEKPELASNTQEPFPAFSNEDPFSRSELSNSAEQHHAASHEQRYEVAATSSVAELDGWHRQQGLDYASTSVSPGELPAQSPISAASRPALSMQQPSSQPSEQRQQRSEFAAHPPWVEDGNFDQHHVAGARTGEGSAAVEAPVENWDDEVTRLAAEQRRLSAEIAEAERVKELKAQKAAVEERLSLLKSKSTGSGAGNPP